MPVMHRAAVEGGAALGRRRPDGVRSEYGTWADAWPRFVERVREICARDDVKRVCEVGGGARPALPPEATSELGVEYTVLDSSADELAKADARYVKAHADITAPRLELGPFDFVFSRLVAEHVHDPAAFHRNVLTILGPGGYALHFFATLYSPPFVVNRALPESASEAIVRLLGVGPVSEGLEKFPALYRWCRGPTARQIRRLEEIGYEVEAYDGFFGTAPYYRRLPPLQRLDERVARTLARRPVPALTSFAHVLVRKPAGGD